MKTKIYYLAHPDYPDIPKYVGKTRISLNERLSKHIYDAKNEKAYNKRLQWLRKLLKNNLIPLIIELDEIDRNTEEFWEIWWINYMKFLGFDLKNCLKEIDYNSYKESYNLRKVNLKKSLKGRKLSKSHVENIRKSRIGWIFSQETKDKISKANKGKKFTKDHINKMRISKTGIESKKIIPIISIDNLGNRLLWKSATECAKKLKIHRPNIVKVLKGVRNMCNNYKFEYVAVLKLDKLLETPEEDNQQPTTNLNV